ncbi:CapA family protein [Limnobacter sp.]|uniref:CapA family protein n=1 Tax=Limnobacter sp. TaxID=2003368 RepID=UPI00374A12B2
MINSGRLEKLGKHFSGLNPVEHNDTCVLMLSHSNGQARATVEVFASQSFEASWSALHAHVTASFRKTSVDVEHVRVDWVCEIQKVTWAELKTLLSTTKRNYFSLGIALDPQFKHSFLWGELNGNAMLYGGSEEEFAKLHVGNFEKYARKKYGKSFVLNHAGEQPVYLFSTQGAYVGTDGVVHTLEPASVAVGRRKLPDLEAESCGQLVFNASEFLARQVKDSGSFVYGIFPCFNKEIPTYNTLRHASSTYAMIEAWELTQSSFLKSAIDRSLHCLTTELIKRVTLSGGIQAAFLVDTGNEIKLGGNAVCILALAKYTELTGETRYIELMEQLAQGIVAMLNPTTRQFVHVLNYPDLSVKEQFRIIYYDGEAAFALMRLYKITRRPVWLQAVELAFEYFIEARHWKANDHWMSYCVNELTLYRPKREYFEFGIRNFSSHLDFVLNRITTFPTLLELMMAAQQMLSRLQGMPEFVDLYAQVDVEKFYRAMHWRANYLLTGYFWPEWAMYFAKPDTLNGAFFIRHHAYRVRIDDVEHYVSGLVAYRKFLLNSPDKTPIGVLDQAAASATGSTQADGPILAWAGDVNLGRRMHYRAHTLGFDKVLSQVPVLKAADLTVVNLECVVSNQGEQGFDKGESGPYYYRARPEMLNILVQGGVDVLCTANNHSGDYGHDALLDQLHWAHVASLGFVGTGHNSQSAFKPLIRQLGDVRIALFNFDLTQKRFAATGTQPGTAYLDPIAPESWKAQVEDCFQRAHEQAHLVVVALHWGNNWSTQPDPRTRTCAHALIECGADLLLGASAHVLHGVEVHRGVPIVYDAGDFLFDSIRKCVTSGVFLCELGMHGVRSVVYVPVGSEFGYTRQYHGHEAVSACEDFERKCQALGTLVQNQGERVLIVLPQKEQVPGGVRTLHDKLPAPADPKMIGSVPSHLDICCVPSVPTDALINLNTEQCQWGPVRLMGIRIHPHELNQRGMLWVETFWSADSVLTKDARLNIRAQNSWDQQLPNWGQGMEHDPCDWMAPTSRWEPGKIYRDLAGLRPPASKAVKNGLLEVKIQWLASDELGNRELVLSQQAVRVLLKYPDKPCQLNEPLKQVSVWLLNQDMGFQRTGVENAALLRNEVFHGQLGVSTTLLTCRYNPRLHESAQQLMSAGALPKRQVVESVYDFLQQADTVDAVLNTGEQVLKSSQFRVEFVPNTHDVRINDTRGDRVMYLARNPANKALNYINHFCGGVKFRKDRYDSRGFLSCIQYLCKSTGLATHEHYLRPNGSLAIAKYHQLVDGKMVLQNIRLHGPGGDLLASLPNEQALIAHALCAMLERRGGKHVLIVDKNRLLYKPALMAQQRIHQQMPGQVAVVPVVHAVHTSGYKNIAHGPTNSNFRDILHDIDRADAIVVLTDQQKTDIQNRYGQGRLFSIGHSYQPVEPPVPFFQRDRFRLVCVARYSPEKNQHMAISAFSKVVHRYPQASLDFYGFGNPGDPTLPGLESLIQSLGLQGRVRLNGWTDKPATQYETAGLSVLSSQGEAFSLTIMESLCHGCPPIAFDVPYGPSHLIDHGNTGLLVPFGNVDAMANAILSLFDNPALHERLCEQARQKSLRFRPEAVALQWQDLFSSLGLVDKGGHP